MTPNARRRHVRCARCHRKIRAGEVPARVELIADEETRYCRVVHRGACPPWSLSHGRLMAARFGDLTAGLLWCVQCHRLIEYVDSPTLDHDEAGLTIAMHDYPCMLTHEDEDNVVSMEPPR